MLALENVVSDTTQIDNRIARSLVFNQPRAAAKSQLDRVAGPRIKFDVVIRVVSQNMAVAQQLLQPDDAFLFEGPAQQESVHETAGFLNAAARFQATVLNYLDRQTMSVCAKMIKEDFSLTNEDVGQLHAAFRGTYAVAHVVAGLMADRFPVRSGQYHLIFVAIGVMPLVGLAAMLLFDRVAATRQT